MISGRRERLSIQDGGIFHMEFEVAFFDTRTFGLWLRKRFGFRCFRFVGESL